MTLTVLLAWLAAFAAIAGLGQWVRRAFGLKAGGFAGWLSAFWIGYAALIALLQALWLFAPITWATTLAIGAVGLLGAALAAAGAGRALRSAFAAHPSQVLRNRRALMIRVAAGAVIGLALLAIAGWVASRALDPRVDFDSAFYHISAIRWRNAYPVLIGLGNLHYRLAFNQSFFLFCAWLNVFPFFGHGYSLANSLLLMTAAARCLAPIGAAIIALIPGAGPRPAPRAALIPTVGAALCLPLVIWRAAPQPYSFNISGPSPDLGVYLFQIMIALSALDLLGVRADPEQPEQLDRREARFTLALITALCAVSVTQKLSAVAFAGAAVAIISGWWIHAPAERRRRAWEAARIIALAALPIAIPWLIIGLLTSGYPAFPNTFGALPVDFRIPLDTTIEARDWVYSWARYPVSSANAAEVLAGWSWLPLWLRLQFSDPTNVFLFVLPAVALVALLPAWALRLIAKGALGRRGYGRAPWSVLLPALIGALFWWLAAPDPRFAGAVFWLAAVSAALFVIGRTRWLGALVGIGALLCAAWMVADGYAESWEERADFPTIYTGPVAPYTTSFGFTYNVSADPAANLQMGDPPLPSSVYRIPGVALRGATLRDGLRTLPTPTPTAPLPALRPTDAPETAP